MTAHNDILRLALTAQGKVRTDVHSALAEEVTGLFDDTHASLVRYLLSFGLTPEDSEEVLQEAFLALFLHLQQGKSRSHLRAWLFRVAHNQGLKRILRNRRNSRTITEGLPELEDIAADPAPDPEARVQVAELHRRLESVIRALPESDRRCLALRAEGLRYREIAEVLDMSLGAVSNSIAKSLERLSRASEL